MLCYDVLCYAVPVMLGCDVTRCTMLCCVTLQVTTQDGSVTVAFHDPIDAISWALHAQLALLEAPWAAELLDQPQARIGTCASGRTIFRGLRVRMAINTGVPAEIIVSGLTVVTVILSEIPASWGLQVCPSQADFF